MKNFFLFFLFFLGISFVRATGSADIYIAKKDLTTNSYVRDLSFSIYDDNNNLVDSWVSIDTIHVASLELGNYKLVEAPIFNNEVADYLSNYYNISVNNDSDIQFIIYNKKIATPIDLSNNNYLYIGLFLIFIGGMIIVGSRKFSNFYAYNKTGDFYEWKRAIQGVCQK